MQGHQFWFGYIFGYISVRMLPMGETQKPNRPVTWGVDSFDDYPETEPTTDDVQGRLNG